MSLLCKDEKLEVTGTVDDFGGKQRLTEDITKAVMNLFYLADIFRVDLAAAIEAEFGAREEESSRQERTAAGEKEPPINGNGGRQDERESGDCAPADAGKGDATTAETSSGSSGENGKDKLKDTYRKFFADATSLELVEQTWTKEIAGNRDFDGKDKAELQPDYATAKKPLFAKQ